MRTSHLTFLLSNSLSLALLMCILAPNVAVAQEESGKKSKSTPSKSVRIYRTPEERREAGYGTQLTSFLRFGGVVDLGQEWQTNHFKGGIESQENNDPEMSIELGFELTSIDWLEAEILFAIEENGRRHFQEVDEGYVGVDFDGLGAKVGWLYLPFGEFYSHFVSGPLVEIGQTRGAAIIADYEIWDGFDVEGYIFESQVNKQGSNNNYHFDWGLAAEFLTEDESIRIGGGYISDLGEGDGEFFLDFNDKFQQRVPGWTVHGLIGLPPFEFTGEIVHATKSIKENDKNADKPRTYNLELAYYPPKFPFLQLAIRYEHSTELEDEPEAIYGIGTTLRFLDNLTIAAEYLKGKFKKRFAFDDNDNEQTSYDLVAIEVTLEF